ncbi:MAG: glutathione S-transferase [Dongiaceae bacterium]
MTITIHHLENSRSQRVIWLLEELGIPYLVKRYERDPKTGMAPPELKEIHPLGKSPVIQNGDVTVAETGAIIDYLVSMAYGKLGQPADRKAAARYVYFMHYAEGSLMPPLFALLVLRRMGEAGKAIATTVQKAFADHLDWLDKEI